MYTYIPEDEHACEKAKGINNNVVKDELKYQNYKIVLFSIWPMKLIL